MEIQRIDISTFEIVKKEDKKGVKYVTVQDFCSWISWSLSANPTRGLNLSFPITFDLFLSKRQHIVSVMNYLFIFPLLGLALGQGSPTALGNLVDTLKTSSLQSILVDLIDAAGLTEALSQGG